MAKKKSPAAAARAAAATKASEASVPAATSETGTPATGTQSAAAPASTNGKRPKLIFDWAKTPYAVFRDNRGFPLAACATKEEAIAVITKLPASIQERTFVAQAKPVKIETKVVI